MRDLKPEEIGHVYGAGSVACSHHRDSEHRGSRTSRFTSHKNTSHKNTEGNNTLRAGHETGGRGA